MHWPAKACIVGATLAVALELGHYHNPLLSTATPGLTCTIQPNICGTNVPPTCLHTACVEIQPSRPNGEPLGNNVRPVSPAGKQIFTCRCHGATPRGKSWFNWSSVRLAGALNITPT